MFPMRPAATGKLIARRRTDRAPVQTKKGTILVNPPRIGRKVARVLAQREAGATGLEPAFVTSQIEIRS
jgi:hypothetical protein